MGPIESRFMMGYEDYIDEEPEERPRDAKIDEAKDVLLGELFRERSDEVFYGRQIEVLFEGRFFHWITSKALRELVAEKKIESEKLDLVDETKVRFYWSKRNRYWKRQAESVRKVILEYSDEEFTRALGHQAEILFSAALPTAGFLPVGQDVRSYRGREWTESEHDLDRVFERDGVGYGTEVKNTLSYIEKDELDVKLRMNEYLGLRPLFIMRMAPKSYVEMIRAAGGFALIFKWQLYPYGAGRLAKKVHDLLGLPVDSPRRIEEGTVRRFVKWHEKSLKGKGV